MTRLLVPELEARRHLIEGYAQFPDVPEDVTNLWKAPFGPPEEWDLCVAEQTIDGPHGPVPVRVYMSTGPAPDGGRACLVWMHGGAFAWGDLDMAEAHEVARGIAGRADVVVVSVDYRLCPVPAELGGTVNGRVDERGRPVRFPIPQDDCAAVLDAVRDDSARLGVDASRIAIGGASAEAALAAAVTLRTVADGHPPWQTLLVYPMLQLGQQPDRNTPPRVDDGEAAMLTPTHLPIPVAPPGQPSTARGPTLEDTEILSTDPGGLAALYLPPQSADPTTHTCERLVELTEWLPGWAWWGSIGRRRP